jgi:3-hydroxybutyryl-CoA dehydrogenase
MPVTHTVGPPVRLPQEQTVTDPAPSSSASTSDLAVGVVGCGLMGSGIAEVCARAGLVTTVVESTAEQASAGRDRIAHSLDRAVKAGKLDHDGRDLALDLLTVTDDMEALTGAGLVVEAVAEVEDLKVDIFRRLDSIVASPDAILASNTSSIPIMKLAMATRRPGSVVGIHFFNPVPVLALVELVPSLLTAEATLESARGFAEDVLGKKAILCQDRAGFVVNALLVPYILSAVRMMESGFATADDIDSGMVLGCAHPMGPLKLADLIGLDTVLAIADSLYEEFKEPLYAPPPLLSRMADAGLLGRKSGRGFYAYGG